MKNFFYFLFFALSINAANAQIHVDESSSVKKNAFFVGPKIGGVMTFMTQPEISNVFDGSGFGFSGGVVAKMRFGRSTEYSEGGTGFWGLALEAKYKQNKAKLIGDDKFSLNCIEIPLLAQVYPFAKGSALNSLYVEVGPDFALPISKSPESLTVSTPNDPNYLSYTYKTGDLKAKDIRLAVGIGYTIPKTGLDINIRYYHGMSNLAENFQSKMSNIEFSLAWMFNVAKF